MLRATIDHFLVIFGQLWNRVGPRSDLRPAKFDQNDQESEKNVFSTTKNHSEPLLTAVEPHQRQIKYQSRTNRNYSWRKNCPYYRENYSILREIQK